MRLFLLVPDLDHHRHCAFAELQGYFRHVTVSAPDGHGMILIERGVDLEDTTYRVI